jgi:multidrug resistance efflux pump
MHDDDAAEPLVIPMREPPPPPRIPLIPRFGRILLGLWPFVAWCAAAAAAAWLYFGESWHGHALAFDDIQEVKVSSSVAGRLSTLSVEQGQKIQEGALIATLDAADLDARIRLAKAEVERQRTRVDAEREALKLEAQDRRAQSEARRNAYEREGRRLRGEAERLAAEQAVDEADLGALAPQIARLQPLLDNKLITADRLEDLIRKRDVLNRRIVARTDAVRGAKEELAAWEKLEPEKLPDPGLDARLLPFELELRAQELKVAELELDRKKYQITAPVSGSVNLVSARAGEWRAPGVEIIEIVVPKPGHLTAYVTDRQVPAVTPGTLATLRPRDRSGKALEGKVTQVGPRIEQVPLRLRSIPTIAQWGRLVTIQVEQAAEPLPGEIYDVRFR